MSCFQSFYPINNRFNLLILLFQKKLFLYFVASSTSITQCCCPPMLGYLIDEMSKFILSPGFSLLSSFFFGIVFCLIFSNEQLRQLLTLPVNFILLYFAVASIKSCPACPSTLWKYSFHCFPCTIAALTSSGFLITILAANKTELPASELYQK